MLRTQSDVTYSVTEMIDYYHALLTNHSNFVLATGGREGAFSYFFSHFFKSRIGRINNKSVTRHIRSGREHEIICCEHT